MCLLLLSCSTTQQTLFSTFLLMPEIFEFFFDIVSLSPRCNRACRSFAPDQLRHVGSTPERSVPFFPCVPSSVQVQPLFCAFVILSPTQQQYVRSVPICNTSKSIQAPTASSSFRRGWRRGGRGWRLHRRIAKYYGTPSVALDPNTF